MLHLLLQSSSHYLIKQNIELKMEEFNDQKIISNPFDPQGQIQNSKQLIDEAFLQERYANKSMTGTLASYL